jgi:hypothetical protein
MVVSSDLGPNQLNGTSLIFSFTQPLRGQLLDVVVPDVPRYVPRRAIPVLDPPQKKVVFEGCRIEVKQTDSPLPVALKVDMRPTHGLCEAIPPLAWEHHSGCLERELVHGLCVESRIDDTAPNAHLTEVP